MKIIPIQHNFGTLSKFKAFFASGKDARELTNSELMTLRREDVQGYDELRDLASAYVDAHPKEFPDVK